METLSLETLRYPVGKFALPEKLTPQEIASMIQTIEDLPAALRAAAGNMTEEQVNTPYREGGWTVRQVVHHLFDSHSNGFTRMKLALTEDNPVIKPYMEALWAEHQDARTASVELGLNLLELLHKRWIIFIRSLHEKDLLRIYYHPEHKRSQTIAQSIANYAWHSRHHLAHITELKIRKGW